MKAGPKMTFSTHQIKAWNHAIEAREWCQQTDEDGNTNFQRVYRAVSAWAMERGRTAITASELRTRFHMSNNYTAAIMRWLVMADRSLCQYIRFKFNEGLDEDPQEFGRLFVDFGVKPANRDHMQALERYRAERAA